MADRIEPKADWRTLSRSDDGRVWTSDEVAHARERLRAARLRSRISLAALAAGYAQADDGPPNACWRKVLDDGTALKVACFDRDVGAFVTHGDPDAPTWVAIRTGPDDGDVAMETWGTFARALGFAAKLPSPVMEEGREVQVKGDTVEDIEDAIAASETTMRGP